MVSLQEINEKELYSFRAPDDASLIPILRDANYASFMVVPHNIYIMVDDDRYVGVLYRTRDDNEVKNIVVLMTFEEEIVTYIESMTTGSTTMFCPSILHFSNLPFFDGGIYRRTCNCNSSTTKAFSKHCTCIPTLAVAKETINVASLPTSDVEKYILWLDYNSDKYVVLEEGRIESILCILKGPVNIVSFYWDSDDGGNNISGLLDYCSSYYNELYAMAPLERNGFLIQNGFLCACDWRLFYNGV